jgi:AraC-like DNA-binding protein
MGQLLVTAPSVGDALARTCRYARLLHDAAEAWGEYRGDHYHFYSTMRGVPMTIAAAESIAGGAIARLRFRLGVEWAPLEMWFQYPEPSYRVAYERFFRCPLRFEMPLGGTVLDAKVLAMSNAVDGAVAELIERRAQSALERLTGVERCADRARDVLGAGLSRGEIGADAVARALHMSRATMTRRLSAEGTTLTEVLDALRRDLALEYVRDPQLSIEELARRLAFSDARALRRAFQRWTGMSPGEVRRKG